jgi:hypothetical protein
MGGRQELFCCQIDWRNAACLTSAKFGRLQCQLAAAATAKNFYSHSFWHAHTSLASSASGALQVRFLTTCFPIALFCLPTVQSLHILVSDDEAKAREDILGSSRHCKTIYYRRSAREPVTRIATPACHEARAVGKKR